MITFEINYNTTITKYENKVTLENITYETPWEEMTMYDENYRYVETLTYSNTIQYKLISSMFYGLRVFKWQKKHADVLDNREMKASDIQFVFKRKISPEERDILKELLTKYE